MVHLRIRWMLASSGRTRGGKDKMADKAPLPEPSNAKRCKRRLRTRQGLPPANAPAPPSSPVSAAPAPPATVKHACGHEAPFREIAKDKFRSERYQKELK